VDIRGLVFAGIESADPAALARFLGGALGVDVREDDGFFFLDLGGDAMAVVPRVRLPEAHDTILGFLVDDVESAAAELVARGVELDGPLREGERFRYQHFRAPDGRVFELVEERAPARA
jgi:glyoxylase I family protein